MSNVQPTTNPELDARVAELERQLAAMRDEVRTRRLVVVDELGRERITADTTGVDADDAAELSISSADELHRITLSQFVSGDDEGMCTSLMATADGDTAWAALSSTDGPGVHVSIDVDRPGARRRLVDEKWGRDDALTETTECERRALVADAEEVLRRAHDVVTRHLALNDRLATEAGPGNDITDEAFNRSGSSRVFDVLLLTQELITRLDTHSTLFDADFASWMAREGLA